MVPLSKSQINKILERARQFKCLVIGDCILDHYIFGDVHRISPEAPVPVVNVDHESYRLGGACNVALNLKQLGCDVSLLGLVGQDKAGEMAQQLLSAEHIQCMFGKNTSTPMQTILKTRVIVRNQQLCRLDYEKFFHQKQAETLLPLLKAELKDKDIVILSDYNKGTITQSLVDLVEAEKATRPFFLAVDPKPQHHLKYQQIDLLKPNQQEALALSGIVPAPYEAFPLKQIKTEILNQCGTRYLAVTLGKQGIAIWDKIQDVGDVYGTWDQEVFDVSGAGDTALSALTIALNAELSMQEAASFANLTSGIVVGKVGTATVTPEELLSYVQ